MHGVVADIAVCGIQRIAIERVEVGADLAGKLFEEAIVVIAQRGLRHGAAVPGFLHQRAIVGNAVITRLLHMQLFQIAVDASVRATGGQHHVNTALARRGDGGFHRWRDGMVGQQQRAVHIDCNQFNSHRVPG